MEGAGQLETWGLGSRLASRSILCENCLLSDFVNYHKRDVQLPAGCKDLIELLDLQCPAQAPARLRLIEGELRYTARYMARLIRGATLPNRLDFWLEQNHDVGLSYLIGAGPLQLQMKVSWTEVDRVKLLREFFVERGFGANKDYLALGAYRFCYSVDKTLAPQLAIDLLKMTYGLNDGSIVRFILEH